MKVVACLVRVCVAQLEALVSSHLIFQRVAFLLQLLNLAFALEQFAVVFPFLRFGRSVFFSLLSCDKFWLMSDMSTEQKAWVWICTSGLGSLKIGCKIRKC